MLPHNLLSKIKDSANARTMALMASSSKNLRTAVREDLNAHRAFVEHAKKPTRKTWAAMKHLDIIQSREGLTSAQLEAFKLVLYELGRSKGAGQVTYEKLNIVKPTAFLRTVLRKAYEEHFRRKIRQAVVTVEDTGMTDFSAFEELFKYIFAQYALFARNGQSPWIDEDLAQVFSSALRNLPWVPWALPSRQALLRVHRFLSRSKSVLSRAYANRMKNGVLSNLHASIKQHVEYLFEGVHNRLFYDRRPLND